VKIIIPATAALLIFSTCGWTQSPQERSFTQSVGAVQAAVKTAGGTAGTLPILDGFVAARVDGLEQYQRPYYKCTVSVLPVASGGSRVRVSAKITAWHGGAKPGYEVLPSNGRLEADLLDRLQQALVSGPKQNSSQQARAGVPGLSVQTAKKDNSSPADAPTISAPTAQFPKHFDAGAPSATAAAPADPALQREADGLSEILRNQSHPTNLVAVKKDQTPVLQNPALDAKVLFLASAEDEFEIIEANPDWVHVRISGLSRGWLRRSLVEVLDGSQAAAAETAPATLASGAATETATLPTSAFSISSEENGNFPGSWEPLKGKTVKIVSVQASGHVTSAEQKLQFAEEMFQKETLAATPTAGLVVIFDTEDGGMIAATKPWIEQYKKGAITEQAFWKQCFIDPPEILGSK
jgi:hypothetical protein